MKSKKCFFNVSEWRSNMNKIRKYVLSLLLICICLVLSPYSVQSADEQVLFTSISPDALIVLDLSGSMNWNPAGGNAIWGASTSCVPNTTACSGTGCSGGYCNASKTGCNVNCSRLAIAKRAIFKILDEDNNNTIQSSGTSTDDTNLNIRFGYMSFCGGNDTDGDYNNGNIRLRQPIGTKYSQIFCNSSSSCSLSISDSGSCTDYIHNTQANSGTPLASSLVEAKSYLDAHKAADTAKDCREKFVILISDGADTYYCSGSGSEDQNDMYKRRRETVARAKALKDAGYTVLVIGFGADMPTCLQRTLNWAAYYGGSDNPLQSNTGDTSAYNIPTGSLYPAGVSACSDATIALATSGQTHFNLCGKNGGAGDTYATSNDPATLPLSGYAFLATDGDQLDTALRQAVNMIRSAVYSFTNISVSTARTTSENDMYVAYMQPIDDEPFWIGRLKKYAITSDGNVGAEQWDAGIRLRDKSAGSRIIKTYKNGAMVDFTTDNITPGDLGLVSTNTTRRNEVVGYIRGEPSFNEDNWKLGDIWHSNPVVITTPSVYYEDKRDINNAFATFRTNNQRTSASGRIVVSGANDGQLHFFRTSDGDEIMSFIPPNMLHKLPLIAHNTHPTSLTHQYFVDGPISAADVWLGSGTGLSKSASEWKTLLVTGLGRGSQEGAHNLWSANTNCTPDNTLTNNGYSSTYSSTTPNYCGYYAFDVTNTLSPTFKWRMNPTSSQQYLGASWSRMALGRVKWGSNGEKWVGFVGGGGFSYSCSGGQPSPPNDNWGKGFFVVDLDTGNVLWSYTKANNSEMNTIFAPVGIVDSDGDGLIDTAYVGDFGGNMWRFKFCLDNTTSCSTSSWTGGLLYRQSTGQIRPIYSGLTITKDPSGNIWVYWGSGDKQCPNDPNAQERFYAVRDDRTSTFTFGDLENLTGPSQTYGGTKNGWSIQIPGNGEKILSDPVVFGGAVYFTTFTPASGSTSPCQSGGTGRLYGVNYLTGGGALSSGARSVTLSGTGIPSSPIISMNPNTGQPDMYVTISGGGGVDSGVSKISGVSMSLPSNKSRVLFWRDRRVQ